MCFDVTACVFMHVRSPPIATWRERPVAPLATVKARRHAFKRPTSTGKTCGRPVPTSWPVHVSASAFVLLAPPTTAPSRCVRDTQPRRRDWPRARSTTLALYVQEILAHLNQFVALRKRARCHAHNDLHLRPKSATLDSCIGVLAIAMSMVRHESVRPVGPRVLKAIFVCVQVMAGTGNLRCLKLLRSLRTRTPASMSCRYGHQMAVHSAIGRFVCTVGWLVRSIVENLARNSFRSRNIFLPQSDIRMHASRPQTAPPHAGLLFLSGGRATLGRSNSAIAALLCALFPVYPMDTMDCRYHLQAFRHLYVLAVEDRCLELHDADTREAIVAPVRLTVTQPAAAGQRATSVTIERMSPCLLPPRDLIERLEVRSPRYWPLQLDKALLNVATPDDGAKVLSFLSP